MPTKMLNQRGHSFHQRYRVAEVLISHKWTSSRAAWLTRLAMTTHLHVFDKYYSTRILQLFDDHRGEIARELLG